MSSDITKNEVERINNNLKAKVKEVEGLEKRLEEVVREKGELEIKINKINADKNNQVKEIEGINKKYKEAII